MATSRNPVVDTGRPRHGRALVDVEPDPAAQTAIDPDRLGRAPTREQDVEIPDERPDRHQFVVGEFIEVSLGAQDLVHEFVGAVQRLVPPERTDLGAAREREQCAAQAFGESRREILVSVAQGTRYRISKWGPPSPSRAAMRTIARAC